MAEQLLKNPEIEPKDDIIAKCLGSANSAYIKFIKGLKAHKIDVEYSYYNDSKAWLGKGLYRWTGSRGGQKETTAFWLSLWDESTLSGCFFKVTIFVPEKYRMEALDLPLNDDIKRMIENSKQMGKLKFFPVVFDLCSDELFDQVYTLIDFRKNIK